MALAVLFKNRIGIDLANKLCKITFVNINASAVKNSLVKMLRFHQNIHYFYVLSGCDFYRSLSSFLNLVENTACFKRKTYKNGLSF